MDINQEKDKITGLNVFDSYHHSSLIWHDTILPYSTKCISWRPNRIGRSRTSDVALMLCLNIGTVCKKNRLAHS